ncbi:MAG: hypothetical protein JJ910_01790 [Maricaulis sp.]|nr:hypothetical protein [Maricaulis sp.]
MSIAVFDRRDLSMFESDTNVSVLQVAVDADGATGPTILLMTWPEVAVSRALLDNADPSAALGQWKSQAKTALQRAKQFGDRLVSRAQSDSALADQIGLQSSPIPSQAEPPFYCEAALLLMPSAARWVEQDNEAHELADQLSRVSGSVRLDPQRLPLDQLDGARALLAKHFQGMANAKELAFNTAFATMRADFERLAANEGRSAGAAFGSAGPIQKIGAFIERLRARASRNSDLDLIRQSGLFDEKWYVNRFPDVDPEQIDPVMHYLVHGGTEGRPSGPDFDSTAYFALNPDLEGLGLNPVVHYLRKGLSEGRPALNLQGRPLEPSRLAALSEAAAR